MSNLPPGVSPADIDAEAGGHEIACVFVCTDCGVRWFDEGPLVDPVEPTAESECPRCEILTESFAFLGDRRLREYWFKKLDGFRKPQNYVSRR